GVAPSPVQSIQCISHSGHNWEQFIGKAVGDTDNALRYLLQRLARFVICSRNAANPVGYLVGHAATAAECYAADKAAIGKARNSPATPQRLEKRRDAWLRHHSRRHDVFAARKPGEIAV